MSNYEYYDSVTELKQERNNHEREGDLWDMHAIIKDKDKFLGSDGEWYNIIMFDKIKWFHHYIQAEQYRMTNCITEVDVVSSFDVLKQLVIEYDKLLTAFDEQVAKGTDVEFELHKLKHPFETAGSLPRIDCDAPPPSNDTGQGEAG